jgi:GalNAc5-diNAcBac-PP-undecaprenol beta-1,3-glucosyltransferase
VLPPASGLTSGEVCGIVLVDPVATIIIPTHDHGLTLRASVVSALRQTCPVEVFLIGDGVPDETRAIVAEFIQAGHPVRFFDHPKGPRNGEAYRDTALREARGSIVCYLSDDDLYFPDHVKVMRQLLEVADFAHAFPIEVRLGGSLLAGTVDLELPAYQRELLEGRNRIPLSAGAHTLAAYRELEVGWSTTPEGAPTDLYMWCKFLRHPGCRFKAAHTPTFLGFPAQPRKQHTTAERYQELQTWLTQLSDDQAVVQLNRKILAQKVRQAAELDARLVDTMRNGGMLTPWECSLQVFFPRPGGYNEQDSARFPMRFKTWRKIAVEIPCALPEIQIRIDPSNTPCLIELARIEVFDPAGELLWALTEDNAYTLQVGGSGAVVSRGVLIRIISDGDDPQIVLPPIKTSAGANQVRLEFVARLDADIRTLTGLLGAYFRIPT